MPRRSLAKRTWYDLLRTVCRIGAVFCWRTRVAGREHVPATGPGLMLSNHQSHLDPILIGVSCERQLYFLARKTLFTFPPLRWLITSLEAIPINRDGLGLDGLKETLRLLKAGEIVVIFPEGTRTRDGAIAPLKAGFAALAKRGHAPLIPVAIDGAYEAWPRTSKFPRPATIFVEYGPPLSPDEAAKFSDRELVAEVQRRIETCLERARARRAQSEPGTHKVDHAVTEQTAELRQS